MNWNLRSPDVPHPEPPEQPQPYAFRGMWADPASLPLAFGAQAGTSPRERGAGR